VNPCRKPIAIVPAALMLVIGAALAIVAAAGAGAQSSPVASPTAQASNALAAPASADRFASLIDIDGPINPATADFIEDSIATADRTGAAALVIRLDTPGGLLSSTRNIVKAILNAPVPVIVYVAPAGAAAASAGTFITESANIAAMAPGTTIGAAHPIEMNGDAAKGVVGEKLENFTASFAATVAHQRGRNEAWIQDAVRKSSSISDDQALKLHVVDIVAANLDDLLAQASGRTIKLGDGRALTLHLAGAQVRPLEMRLGERVLNRLADPNLMYLLMLAGMIGLYFEFAHPGAYLPGVAGAICILLALASFEVIPINLAGLMLVMLGAALLVAEIFVTSFGVLGIGGVIAFVLGSLFLVDTSQTNLAVNRGIIAGAAVGFSAIVLGIGYLVLHARRPGARTGAEGLVGEIGEVREPIAPGAPGRLFVHGEIWRAVSDRPHAAGTRAQVVAVNGLEVTVQSERSEESRDSSLRRLRSE